MGVLITLRVTLKVLRYESRGFDRPASFEFARAPGLVLCFLPYTVFAPSPHTNMSMLLRNSVSRTAFTAAPGALALRQQPARLYATEGARPAESHVKPQAPGKTPSFFKRISVEVTPLIGFVSVLLCIAAGAAVHHCECRHANLLRSILTICVTSQQ